MKIIGKNRRHGKIAHELVYSYIVHFPSLAAEATASGPAKVNRWAGREYTLPTKPDKWAAFARPAQ